MTESPVRITSPRWLRGIATFFLATLVLLEAMLLTVAAQIARLIYPAADPRAPDALALLAIVLVAQAAAVLVACVAIWRTGYGAVEVGPEGLTFTQPGRRRSVPWGRVTRAYVGSRRMLHFEVDGRYWGTRRVLLGRDAAPTVEALRQWLPAGAWMEGAALGRYVLRKAVPAIVAVAIVGALAIRLVDSRLRALASTIPCTRGQSHRTIDAGRHALREASAARRQGAWNELPPPRQT